MLSTLQQAVKNFDNYVQELQDNHHGCEGELSKSNILELSLDDIVTEYEKYDVRTIIVLANSRNFFI